MTKYLITDTRYYIVEADSPEKAVEYYEDAREDYSEDDFEIENPDNEYLVQPMERIH